VFLQVAQASLSPMCTHVLSEVSSRMGIRLVLDDFGGPASTLRQLVELAPALVKLDAELIHEIDSNRRKRTAVSSIVRMCAELNTLVVAKGIQTESELRALVECGVNYGQGTLLGPPSELPTISKWRGTR